MARYWQPNYGNIFANVGPLLGRVGIRPWLELDFKERFPESNLWVFSHWESFSQKVKAELSKIGINSIESEAELLHNFLQLFSICPVKGGKKGKAWRPSRPEILQSFLLHVQDMSAFPKELDRITKTALKYGSTVQSFPLLVGRTLTELRSFYVVIDDSPISVESVLRALEVTFKSYFALHCEYPLESRRQWTVLQKTLFQLDIPSDKVNPIANLPEVKRLIKILKY
ncbi:uncharacterized protein LOC117181927 [Belonocnema kinseyi]|uniref:uncharacterized protein LOC117181927 n=1 Tax=Belonocnema kinseyi TaxID=2817044 RepID=UPI00143CF8DB|nr:uncharacterized protein LOC117181927 [Belonocnema kinseyi]